MIIIHLLVILGMAMALVTLVRRGLIHVDMTFPWLVAVIVLGALSVFEGFVAWVAVVLNFAYPPIAIVFITIFVLLGLITALLIGYSRLRVRQIEIVRRIAALEIRLQNVMVNDESEEISTRQPS
jgi:hypothetical protein